MGTMDFIFIKDSFQYNEDGKTLKRTPQGFVKVKAKANRTGIQTYFINGKTLKRYRSPEQVFSTDSLETLKNVPLTVGHPSEAVTIDNFKNYGVGHTTDDINIIQDGEEKYTEVELLLTDSNTISKVEQNMLTELSCGYKCLNLDQQGTYKNETYDQIQTNIEYNHIALLPTGTARAGRKARIKLVNDSLEMVYDSLDDENSNNNPKGVKKTMKIKINGVEFEVDDLVGQAFNHQLTKDSNDLLEVKNKLEEITKENGELKGKITVLDAQLKEQPNINDKVNEKLVFIEKAKTLVKDSNSIDITMDSVEVMKTVVKERLPHVVLDEKVSNDELKGMFNTLQPLTNDRVDNFFKIMGNTGKELEKDAKDKPNTLSPRAKMLITLENASKKGEK